VRSGGCFRALFVLQKRLHIFDQCQHYDQSGAENADGENTFKNANQSCLDAMHDRSWVTNLPLSFDRVPRKNFINTT
jgi:hypothetical protein